MIVDTNSDCLISWRTLLLLLLLVHCDFIICVSFLFFKVVSLIVAVLNVYLYTFGYLLAHNYFFISNRKVFRLL